MLMETVQNHIIISITESCLFKPYQVCSKYGSDPTAESHKPSGILPMLRSCLSAFPRRLSQGSVIGVGDLTVIMGGMKVTVSYAGKAWDGQSQRTGFAQ